MSSTSRALRQSSGGRTTYQRDSRRVPTSSQTIALSASTELSDTEPIPVLRLRGASLDNSTATTRSIRWDESVVNNEGMGKKSSKVCCIYHAPREFGESSEESSSDSDSSDTDEPHKNGAVSNRTQGHAQPTKGRQPACGGIKKKRRPNAYEKTSKPRKDDRDQEPAPTTDPSLAC
ncbi:BgTH12-06634 [Blumeria graminis f. sp. triticale]|uniref:Type 1 phosphatases regulator n=1 Tax=Blumeria graminis f. sp. triticale TaxID=1689686 RepID=A0A9W4GEJ4_BLUGR|nr:BgTH12-06634 [Blumeria graminis f. sp. triticale]